MYSKDINVCVVCGVIQVKKLNYLVFINLTNIGNLMNNNSNKHLISLYSFCWTNKNNPHLIYFE